MDTNIQREELGVLVSRDALIGKMTEAVLAGECEIQEAIDTGIEHYVYAVVVEGTLSTKALRQMVRSASDLDMEAVEIYGAQISRGSHDEEERLARRIFHHASRGALGQVKSDRKRVAKYVEVKRQYSKREEV